ncbi:hypothetical protein C8R45DRAFT_1111649 [Mycena sanguinolenta]|nr:hypothetical protein C8R45DRAFT_1111649 [Mycena sanguinolenta]
MGLSSSIAPNCTSTSQQYAELFLDSPEPSSSALRANAHVRLMWSRSNSSTIPTALRCALLHFRFRNLFTIANWVLVPPVRADPSRAVAVQLAQWEFLPLILHTCAGVGELFHEF